MTCTDIEYAVRLRLTTNHWCFHFTDNKNRILQNIGYCFGFHDLEIEIWFRKLEGSGCILWHLNWVIGYLCVCVCVCVCVYGVINKLCLSVSPLPPIFCQWKEFLILKIFGVAICSAFDQVLWNQTIKV